MKTGIGRVPPRVTRCELCEEEHALCLHWDYQLPGRVCERCAALLEAACKVMESAVAEGGAEPK